MTKFGPVYCGEHGERKPTFVCQHLVHGSGLGFVTPFDQPPDAPPNAWCAGCEDVRAEQGGWDDITEEFASIKMICDICFEVARQRNQDQADGDEFRCFQCRAVIPEGQQRCPTCGWTWT